MHNQIKLLIATSNPGKVRELRALLSNFNFEIVTPIEIGISTIPEETGASYLENALLKGHFYADQSRMAVLADDTGLEVDALDGQPGLYSARFSTLEEASDAERRLLLLQKLQSKPQPWHAHFTCTAVLIDYQGNQHPATGRCDGQIISTERGTNGFGYDPIFFFPDLNKTMAELELDQKNRISHRARAVHALSPYLLNLSRQTK
jgi:XTP/dITP diphosphohydrolase